MSAADLRKQLKELRKLNVPPLSKMKKADISAEIQRLGGKTETTPHSAATPSPPPKQRTPAVGSIKEAKAKEFPVKPAEGKAAKMPKAAPAEAPKKKASKMERLMAALAEMSSDEE